MVIVFFIARSPALAEGLGGSSADALKVLIKGCTAFTVVTKESEIPVGCVSENVSQDLAVALLLKVGLFLVRSGSFLEERS